MTPAGVLVLKPPRLGKRAPPKKMCALFAPLGEKTPFLRGPYAICLEFVLSRMSVCPPLCLRPAKFFPSVRPGLFRPPCPTPALLSLNLLDLRCSPFYGAFLEKLFGVWRVFLSNTRETALQIGSLHH